MIEIAQILPHETIVDIGSGDGRVLIGAASSVCLKKAIGIEIDSTLVALSRRKIIESNLQDKIEIIHKDWLDVSLEKVDVVILFFLPHEKIASILTEKLLPGTRIVTYVFQISQWKPEKIIETVPFMTSKGNSTIYLYRVPELKTA
jgi:tRNA A58 N-methylase Trm61